MATNNNAKLSERAMLCALHVGSWAGTMYDQSVSKDIGQLKKADSTAGRYNKQLVDRKVLRPVNMAVGIARQTHRLLTLPWDDSSRILSATGHTHYADQMRRCRLSLEAHVGDLIKFYPDYVGSDENKKRLGTMYAAEDFPSAKDLKARYYVDVEIKPVPEAGDFRTKLSDASTKAIIKDIERRSEERLNAAMKDVFERIIDSVGKMVERLRAFKPATKTKNPENTFRDSLVYNINDLAELLPTLNITADPRLDELQAQLKSELVEHSPEILRADKHLRKETADRAAEILKKVKGFLA